MSRTLVITIAVIAVAAVVALVTAVIVHERRAGRIHSNRMVALRITVGVILLIVGVIGGFIPILQGWIFILLGFLVLFPHSRAAESILKKADPKVPRVVRFLRRIGIGERHEVPRSE